MRILLKKYPRVSRYVLALVLFASALFVSLLINKGILKQYIPYTAPLLLVLATFILYKKEGQSLSAIGLNMKIKNLSFLAIGIFIGALAFLGAKYLLALYNGQKFELTNSIDYSTILLAFYFILPQVATEELLFRGYLFKKTIEMSNVAVANVIFSILFMLIHVLDKGVLSNKGMIFMLVVAIPVGHLLFATALLKTRTLFFPIGIHLGNNWASRHLISTNNDGGSILYIPEATTFDTWIPFIISLLIFNSFFLFITFIIWKWDKNWI